MVLSSRKKKTLKKSILILPEIETTSTESKDEVILHQKIKYNWRVPVVRAQWSSLLTTSWAFSSNFIKEPLFWTPECLTYSEIILWFAGLDVHKDSVMIGIW
jgi:hypothetical protein